MSDPVNPVLSPDNPVLAAQVEPKSDFDQLREIIVAATGYTPDEVAPTSKFGSDLPVDSLTKIDIAVRTEDHFGVILDEEKIDGVEGVADLLALIEAHGKS